MPPASFMYFDITFLKLLELHYYMLTFLDRNTETGKHREKEKDTTALKLPSVQLNMTKTSSLSELYTGHLHLLFQSLY